MSHTADSDFLFVYGSLKRSFEHEMHQHLVKFATFTAEGTFQGKLYRIDWYPGMIDSEIPSDRVSGEIYQMHQPEQLLKILDAYEGFDPAKPEQSEYLRVVRPVHSNDGTPRPCHLYLYNWPLKDAKRIESGVF